MGPVRKWKHDEWGVFAFGDAASSMFVAIANAACRCSFCHTMAQFLSINPLPHVAFKRPSSSKPASRIFSAGPPHSRVQRKLSRTSLIRFRFDGSLPPAFAIELSSVSRYPTYRQVHTKCASVSGTAPCSHCNPCFKSNHSWGIDSTNSSKPLPWERRTASWSIFTPNPCALSQIWLDSKRWRADRMDEEI